MTTDDKAKATENHCRQKSKDMKYEAELEQSKQQTLFESKLELLILSQPSVSYVDAAA